MKKEVFTALMDVVATRFDLSPSQMLTKTKSRTIVDARQILWWVAKKRNIRVVAQQEYLKDMGFDVTHSTIIHGIKQAQKLIDADPDYKKLINDVRGSNVA